MTGGDSWLIDADGLPAQQGLTGPFAQAFPDSTAAANAVEGLRILHQTTDFDPERNWVDFLRPRVYANKPSSQVFTYGPTGSMYYDETTHQSGGRALKFNGAGPLAAPEAGSPVFRLRSSTTYRCTYTWKSTQAVANRGIDVSIQTLSGDKLSMGAGHGVGTLLAGSNNLWVTDSYVFTTDNNIGWAYFYVVANITAGQDTYIDSITLTPVPPSWRFTKTGNQTNLDAAAEIITFDATSWAIGVTDDRVANARAVITTPGRYLVGAGLALACGTATESMDIRVVVSGALQFVLAGAEMARVGAVVHAVGSVPLELVRGDYVNITGASSAATADVVAATYTGHFWGIKVG